MGIGKKGSQSQTNAASETQRTLTLANPAFRPLLTASYDRTDSRTVYALPFQLGAPAS